MQSILLFSNLGIIKYTKIEINRKIYNVTDNPLHSDAHYILTI